MRPNQIEDDLLGELNWDAGIRWWCGQATMADGTPFLLYIHTVAYETQLPPFEDSTWDRTITPKSRQALARVQHSDASVREAVAREYLPIFNSNWNDDQPIDEATFKNRLKLESVTLLPSGGAEFFFADDGMFAGHALIAHQEPNGTTQYVEMFG